MKRSYRLCGFDFDYDLTINNKVGSKRIVNNQFFKGNLNGLLPFNGMAQPLEIARKDGFIGRLEEARAKF